MPEKPFFKTGVGIFLLGMVIGELLPDITDILNFYLQNYLKNHPELPLWLFWTLQLSAWYLLTASFLALLMLVAYLFHIRNVKTIKIILLVGGILSISAVITLLWLIFKINAGVP